eukprot:CCRYP_009514-RB/>CCRYP_009514-RB protein AED:0.39 eAED:0.39 QI:0/0.66/0.5/1/0.66/0.75/4/384/342
MLELEESIAFEANSQRYPYIAKLLDFISAGKYGDEVIFQDVLSEKDVQAVTSMVNTRDDLEWRYVPLSGESVDDSHHRKLCIAKRKKESCADGETPANASTAGEESNEGREGSDLPHSNRQISQQEPFSGHTCSLQTLSLAHRGPSDYNENRPDGPRRGDLVFFGKTKGAKWAKDIRIEKLDAANTVKGVLVDIKPDENTAVFVSSDTDTKYNISLSAVVSCEKSLLREKQEVNGVLHDGKIFGVCRMKDIFLTSCLAKNSSGSNNGPKQRPKLNLTVKKELQGMGGQIMAQSKMAKGPDGTIGFVHGWTKRLSPNAKTFIPSTIQVSGFNSTHSEEDTSGD